MQVPAMAQEWNNQFDNMLTVHHTMKTFHRTTVESHYNSHFLINIHNTHLILHPLGWQMGCLLQVQRLLCVLSQHIEAEFPDDNFKIIFLNEN